MNLFYSPNIAQTLCLSEEESAHCVQVLRLTKGDNIFVTDGVGALYLCQIINPHRKHCEIQIIEKQTPQPVHNGYVHIAIAPTKNIDRLEWAIEKCTEMGVNEITPILCEHSERRKINDERLQKIMVAAAKQSLKTTFPILHPLTPLKQLDAQGKRFIAHCATEQEQKSIQTPYQPTNSKHLFAKEVQPNQSITILIGPEGDFSPAEIEWALNNGYQPVSLGNARLRTETAAMVACATAVQRMSE